MKSGRLIEIGSAIAAALAAAHDKGIVHRDLKPANVMVARDGRVKVLDFGLAKIAASQPDEPLNSEMATDLHTREGVVMGTVPYMSPEQIAGRAVDHTTDIFSLGVLLYEMATGQRPFEGRSSAELASAILRDTPRSLAELRSDLPAGLAQVIGRCLEKRGVDRFPSARDVRDGLRLKSAAAPPIQAAGSRPIGGEARVDREGFWVAVLPFKCTGADTALSALADGLSEEIVDRPLALLLPQGDRAQLDRSGTRANRCRASSAGDLGARYVMEGSLRQAGTKLRLAVQLVDATTGAHLWAENYERTFSPDAIFELQDDLVPRIVSTVADMHGILPRRMSEAVRGRSLPIS